MPAVWVSATGMRGCSRNAGTSPFEAGAGLYRTKDTRRDPTVGDWDDEYIYRFRRWTLAPTKLEVSFFLHLLTMNTRKIITVGITVGVLWMMFGCSVGRTASAAADDSLALAAYPRRTAGAAAGLPPAGREGCSVTATRSFLAPVDTLADGERVTMALQIEHGDGRGEMIRCGTIFPERTGRVVLDFIVTAAQ